MATAGHARNHKREKVLAALREGNTRKAAYDYAGIGHDTFYRWLEEDRIFSEAVTHAEAAAEHKCATALMNAVETDWRAAEAWLKRRRGADWKEIQGHEHSGSLEILKRVGNDPDEL